MRLLYKKRLPRLYMEEIEELFYLGCFSKVWTVVYGNFNLKIQDIFCLS